MKISILTSLTTLHLHNRHLLVMDLLTAILIPFVTLTVVLGRIDWWSSHALAVTVFTGIWLTIWLVFSGRAQIYARYWPTADLEDYTRLTITIYFAAALVALLYYILHQETELQLLRLPVSFVILNGFFTTVAHYGNRAALHSAHVSPQPEHLAASHKKRALIVGAGEAGALAAKELRSNRNLAFEAVLFVDDDETKRGKHIGGIPVAGPLSHIPELVHTFAIEQIFMAIPSASLKRRLEITAICRSTNVPISFLPGLYEIMSGNKSVRLFGDFDVATLLDREPIVIDNSHVADSLRGKTVLVTGAGGSIGRELCRQISQFAPETIILLGHGENSIFEIGLELRILYPHLHTEQVIADVRSASSMNDAMAKHKPHVVFHAAAHKHVLFMELNVSEAALNNVLGSWNVMQAAAAHDVERFVLISSDKAVNPTSVMGTTKRIAELLMQEMNAQSTQTAFMAVRFGNVLGSRGSVVPKFQQQILAGGPITVTDPNMKRYFMTIPEAVQLLLQASTLGAGGEIFVLDMGEPVSIAQLARNLLACAGLKIGRDIDIVFSGIQPGEKLFEELFFKSENYRRTKYDKIFVGIESNHERAESLANEVHKLIHYAQMNDNRQVIQQMQKIVPEYSARDLAQSSESKANEPSAKELQRLSAPLIFSNKI
ncbi:MAG: nucleoside-diphosphate sugar epimerase/dehydratase [Caldilineaceae bacterium]